MKHLENFRILALLTFIFQSILYYVFIHEGLENILERMSKVRLSFLVQLGFVCLLVPLISFTVFVTALFFKKIKELISNPQSKSL